MAISETMARLFGRAAGGSASAKLARRTVEQDAIDKMEFGNYADDSPRFRRIAIEEAPVVVPEVDVPEPPDITQVTPEEFKAWQAKAREAKKLQDSADPYRNWPDLTEDLFTSYHHHDEPTLAADPVDPGVDVHRRIMGKVITNDEFASSRNITRNDATMAAMATMAFTHHLRDALGEELAEQTREAQEFERLREEVQDRMGELESLRDEAKSRQEAGQPIPPELVEEIKQAVRDKRAAMHGATQIAENQTPMSQAAAEAIAEACSAAAEAAEVAAGVPSFGAGFGQGEPVYESPEQALTIAEMWANNPDLKAMAELYGRLDNDIRFHRSRRVEGGADEIVDVQFGDNLNRVLPSELALLGDPDFEDDFLLRYSSRELLEFSTVGEESAGRGPIVLVIDGSGTMSGERNIWARAIALSLLHIARREKRDFAAVEFSSATEIEQWVFEAKKPLDPELIVEMASHFFGGGTAPLGGISAGAKIMRDAPAFKKADLVLIGDGDAGFDAEDRRMRDQLSELGVRIFGIGIGGTFGYLEEYCEFVVSVHDFELTDPSAATAELATHVT